MKKQIDIFARLSEIDEAYEVMDSQIQAIKNDLDLMLCEIQPVEEDCLALTDCMARITHNARDIQSSLKKISKSGAL